MKAGWSCDLRMEGPSGAASGVSLFEGTLGSGALSSPPLYCFSKLCGMLVITPQGFILEVWTYTNISPYLGFSFSNSLSMKDFATGDSSFLILLSGRFS